MRLFLLYRNSSLLWSKLFQGSLIFFQRGVYGAFPAVSFKLFSIILPTRPTHSSNALCSRTFPTPSHNSPPPFSSSTIARTSSLSYSSPFIRIHPPAHASVSASLSVVPTFPFQLPFSPHRIHLISLLYTPPLSLQKPNLIFLPTTSIN